MPASRVPGIFTSVACNTNFEVPLPMIVLAPPENVILEFYIIWLEFTKLRLPTLSYFYKFKFWSGFKSPVFVIVLVLVLVVVLVAL